MAAKEGVFPCYENQFHVGATKADKATIAGIAVQQYQTGGRVLA